MDAQTPIQDTQQPVPEKDEAKVSQKHWPWVVGGLVAAIVILWNTHIKDAAKIEGLNNERIKDQKDVSTAWQQIAAERKDLKASTAYFVHYTNDTSIQRRIDSAVHAEQSR